MIRNILLVVIAFLALSCSQDGEDNAQIARYEIKLPAKITLLSANHPELDRVYEFTYDNRNRLTSTTVSGALNAVFEYSYNEFQLNTVTVNDSQTFTIQYDNSGRLAAVVNNGATTPITYDSATDKYTYGSNVFSIREKDIEKINLDRFYLLGTAYWGPFYSVLGYNSFAALLTDDVMLNFATRRPAENLLHPLTHESRAMAFSIGGGEYFYGGTTTFEDDTQLTLSCIFMDAIQYEDIERL